MPLRALSAVSDYGPAASAFGLLPAVWPRSPDPGFDIDRVEIGGCMVPVREVVVAERPFCRLRQFHRAGHHRQPAVLVVAPLSGQFAGMLRDMVLALLPGHDVHVADWLDAREVPLEQGRFDFADNIGYVMDFLRRLGPDSHVIGLCQSALPTLAAIALLAQGDDALAPKSLTLISGLLDPRIQQTRVERLLAARSRDWFERNVIATVPAGFAGRGRRVYPGYAQLGGLMVYLARHMRSRDELYRKLTHDDGADAPLHAFFRRYVAVMDLPAEFFLDLAAVAFRNFDLPKHQLTWRGIPVEPAAIRHTALMTVEGALDDISAPGQTAVAHRLCPNIPAERRRQHLQPGIGHYGSFHGRAWREAIAPRIADFIRSAA